jgi:hypothetical protein
VPQAVLAVPASQVVPSQHPVVQSAALQYAVQDPATHSLPKLHAAHAAPLTPHVVSPLAWQTPFASQQPFGQLAASQTHAPPTHSAPATQATQAAPPAPHAASVVPTTQSVAMQHPVGQSAGLQYATHVWSAHSLSPLHTAQAAPPLPHAALVVPAWQSPDASQQPFGQLLVSQWHAPLTHSCPAGHATHAAPFAPHSAFVMEVTQVVPAQHPVGQSAWLQYAVQL